VIAPQKFVSVRTLQRRLRAEGLVFERLVDDVRREQAITLSEDRTLPLSDVAGLLGYVEQSSFSHRVSPLDGHVATSLASAVGRTSVSHSSGAPAQRRRWPWASARR
jgi:AraC-like DNA-binding protein